MYAFKAFKASVYVVNGGSTKNFCNYHKYSRYTLYILHILHLLSHCKVDTKYYFEEWYGDANKISDSRKY